VNFIGSIGYGLISEYHNVKDKIDLVDHDGYKYQSSIDYLKSGKRPRKFDKCNKFTIENIKLYLSKNNIELTLISNEYKNSDEKLKFICSCGCTFYCLPMQIQGGKCACNNCMSLSGKEKRNFNINYVREYFVSRNLTPLFNEYTNCFQKLLCKDNDNYMFLISFDQLRRGQLSHLFSKHNSYTIYNIKNYIIINNLPCKILSESFNGNNRLLSFQCPCGEIYETTWSHFCGRKVVRCKKCSKSQSRYEYAVECYLKEMNISYKKQVKFIDCVNKRPLPFDFMVSKNNIFFLIEVDGEPHYRGYLGKTENLKNQKHRDSIKDNYCIKNNIKLLRIPYWEVNDNTYQEKINSNLYEINAS